jgi:acetoin utilization deacetylase AcuC-like enzyme
LDAVFLEHPTSLEHDTGSHPERAARIAAIERELGERGWLGFERVRSPAVARATLEAVHSPAYVDAIERMCAGGGGALDLDTPVSRGSFQAALHAAGGAVRMVELLLDGEASVGFSAHRPPGHHALPARGMGFCLFNNVAVAARFALRHRGLERVMVIDWDVHHGNGTNDIFHASDEVLFVSIHQWPLYPGTGPASDVGEARGEGYTVNLPVPPGSGDAVFVSLVRQVVLPLMGEFAPQLVLVSAGYDAHREDPLAACEVSEEGFAEMARIVRGAAHAAGAPVGCVLEGGYAPAALARSVGATMAALVEPLERGGQPVAERPAAMTGGAGAATAARALAEEARGRLARWWPSLGHPLT